MSGVHKNPFRQFQGSSEELWLSDVETIKKLMLHLLKLMETLSLYHDRLPIEMSMTSVCYISVLFHQTVCLPSKPVAKHE